MLEHFREDDYDAISSAVQEKLNLTLAKRDMALKGWNWGKADVSGSTLGFQINGVSAFDLPLKYISNTNLTAKQEVSVEFSLPGEGVDSEADKTVAAANVDQLVEMRFYIPSESAKSAGADEDGDGEQNEEPEKSAAQSFHERLKDMADVGEVAGDAIASFSDVAMLTPRGRYDIDLYESSMRLRGKTYDYKVQYNAVVQLFALPRNDETNIILVVGLDPPMRQGQTRYPYLVLQFSKQEDMEVELNLDNETYESTYKDRLQKTYDSAAHDVVGQILKGMTGRKVVRPSSFVTTAGQPSLKCNNKANEGALYLLDKSALFVTKPCIFLPFSETSNVTFSRVAASVSAGKTFDVTFRLKNGTEHQFTSINRDEQKRIEDFLATRNVRIKNDLQEEAELLSTALGDDGDGDLDDDVPDIRGSSGDEDEESPDEDFVGDDDSDDDALEYDSDASASGDDDDDAQEEAPPRKKSKK